MKQTFLFFCFMCCATLVFSQDNYDSELIPSGLKSRANATIRTDETTIDMRAPDNVMLSVKKAITVLNKNGDDKARLVLFYDKTRQLRVLKARFTMPPEYSQKSLIKATSTMKVQQMAFLYLLTAGLNITCLQKIFIPTRWYTIMKSDLSRI